MCQVCDKYAQAMKTAQTLDNGKTMSMKSPKTGRMTLYHGWTNVQVLQSSPASPDEVRFALNQKLAESSVDAWSDETTIVGGLFSTSVRFDGWVAAEDETGKLSITGILLAIIALIVVCVIAYTVLTFTNTIRDMTTGHYVDDDGIVYPSKEELAVAKKTRFWLVCPQCLACFAPRSEYPAYEDIPIEIINMFNEHVKNCPGLPSPDGGLDWLGVLAIVAVGVVGIWALAKVGGSWLSRPRD